MAIASVAGFVETLCQHQLLEGPQRQELTDSLQQQFPEPRALARELLRRNWLTAYQVNQLFLGRGADLLLGPYLLQERLGEGGMGQVFKARHRNLGRTVALKVIRKECLDNPNALPRFQREIQAAAQLAHPNVVHALDADQVDGTYFFAMEYVDGIDLSRLLKQSGPLPVLQACDYTRQAALGLQHAHERGMVHRDIKPANLLVARLVPSQRPPGSSAHLPRPFASAYRWGLVKILDMGLARVLDRDKGRVSTLLTQVGAIMGTPDFIAPEQARNSHTSDIRADLYSLGCTLYYLLCGQAPFPNGSVTEKLLAHQLDDPEPVAQVRRARLLECTPAPGAAREARALLEVPPEVDDLLRKLLAKAPEERYQTPAELAGALGDLIGRLEAGRPARARLKPTDRTIVQATAGGRPGGPPTVRRAAGADSSDTERLPARCAPSTQRMRRPPEGKRRWIGPRTRGKLVWGGFLLLVLLSGRTLEDRDKAALSAPPARQDATTAAWAKLLDKVKHAGANDEELRQELLAFRVAHVGTPHSRRAAEVLMGLVSPFDGLQADAIPKKLRSGWFPPELVAILGEWRPMGALPALCVACSPDGKQLARGGADHLVRRWDARSLRELPPLRGHKDRVHSLAWSPDGLTVASGSQDGVLILWDAASGAVRAELQAQAEAVLCLAFSPDGKRLASGGSWDGGVRLWDVRTAAPLASAAAKTAHRVLSLAWSPDGGTLACGQDDHLLRLWDVTSAEPRGVAVYQGNTSWVKVVAFSPDGKTLVSGGGGDGDLRVCTWDGKEFKEGKVLHGHTNVVHAVAFTLDGRALVSGGEDRSVCVWDVTAGKVARQWDDLRWAIKGVAFAPDGRHVIAANSGNTVYVLRLAAPRPLVVRAKQGP